MLITTVFWGPHEQLANAADYGLGADFALHFGAYRCACQVTSLHYYGRPFTLILAC